MSRRRVGIVALVLAAPFGCGLLDSFPDLADAEREGGPAATDDAAGDDGPVTVMDASDAADAAPPDCTPSTTRPCGFEECQGTERCNATGHWDACSVHDASVELCATATDESCDGVGACNGDHRWSAPLAGAHASSVVVNAAGDVLVGGSFAGDLGLPDGTTIAQKGSPSYADGFVVKLTRAGAFVWARTYADAPVASMAAGKSEVFASGPLLAVSSAAECGALASGVAFTLRLRYDGVCTVARTFANAATILTAADPTTDDTVLAGELVGPLAVGGAAPPIAPSTDPEETSAYVVTLDPKLGGKKAQTFASKNLVVHGLAVSHTSRIAVSGMYGGFLFLMEPKGPQTGFAVLFSDSMPIVEPFRIGDAANVDPSSVAFGSDDRLVVSGVFVGRIDLTASRGPILVSTLGSYDAFVLVKSPISTGPTLAASFGSTGLERPRAVAIDLAGAITWTGYVQDGEVTLGGPTFDAPASATLFVGKLDESLAPVWTRFFPAPGNDFGNAVGIGALGDVYVAGDWQPALDLGGGALDGGGGAFVTRRRP